MVSDLEAYRNSARHDLSIDPRFVTHSRNPLDPGRGKYWSLDENIPADKITKSRKLSATPLDFVSSSKSSQKTSGSVHRRPKSNSVSYAPYGQVFDDQRYYTTYYPNAPVIQAPTVPSYLYYPST